MARAELAIAGSPEADELTAAALAPREACLAWLERELHKRDRAAVAGARPEPFGAATAEVNALLAWLIVAVEQGLATAFVLWHADAGTEAEAAWAASGAAMRQATAVAGLFAAHGAAPAPAAAAASWAALEPPRASGDPEEAERLRRVLAQRCGAAASAAAERATGISAAPLCREIAARPCGRVASAGATFPSFAIVHQRYITVPARARSARRLGASSSALPERTVRLMVPP